LSPLSNGLGGGGEPEFGTMAARRLGRGRFYPKELNVALSIKNSPIPTTARARLGGKALYVMETDSSNRPFTNGLTKNNALVGNH